MRSTVRGWNIGYTERVAERRLQVYELGRCVLGIERLLRLDDSGSSGERGLLARQLDNDVDSDDGAAPRHLGKLFFLGVRRRPGWYDPQVRRVLVGVGRQRRDQQ